MFLRFFIIAIISVFTIAMQNYTFAAAAANLTYRLRTLTLRAILRQDSEYMRFTIYRLPFLI